VKKTHGRGHTWRQVALARQLSQRAVRRARIESLVLLPLLAGILVAYGYRHTLFPRGWDSAVRTITALAVLSLGWQLARDIGRAFGPTLFRRLEPGTAGTVGFLIRLATLSVVVVIALRVAGLRPGTVVLGGAATAVVFGLAAQQALANVIAGAVLLNARTFRVGERVRLQGGSLAGSVEGIVSSLGLMYTTLAQGADTVLVPNSVVLNVAVVPLREPVAVDLRARLRPGSTPLDVEELLKGSIETPIRGSPRITLRRSMRTRSSCASPPPRSIHGTARGSPARCSERSLRRWRAAICAPVDTTPRTPHPMSTSRRRNVLYATVE
jgi:small conductance mechanosensitive channel